MASAKNTTRTDSGGCTKLLLIHYIRTTTGYKNTSGISTESQKGKL